MISDKEKRITAFHEAGHAILFHVLSGCRTYYTVSIIPTGIAQVIRCHCRNAMISSTREADASQNIQVALGGRIAEEMIFDDITTGASQDIKQATAIAKSMVTKHGMSAKVGLVSYGQDDDEVFIGRDLAHTRGYSENVASSIDSEVKQIIDECYQKAKQVIEDHRQVLNSCAELLLEKEKIGTGRIRRAVRISSKMGNGNMHKKRLLKL